MGTRRAISRDEGLSATEGLGRLAWHDSQRQTTDRCSNPSIEFQ